MNFRYYIPFERIQPFALAGMGLMQSIGTDGKSRGAFAGRFGVGIDFYLTTNWVLEASTTYVLPGGDLKNSRYLCISAGLQYRFDPFIY